MTTVKKIRVVLVAAAAALCVSCLPVPFDLGLSQSAAAVKKMTLDNSALLTMGGGFDRSAHDFAFYPSVTPAGLDYSNGFVLSQRNLDLDISLVQQNGSSYTSFGQQSWTMANQDPHLPSYLAWPMESGSTYLLNFIFDAFDPLNGNDYYVNWGDPVGHSISQVNISNAPNIFNMHSELNFDFGVNANPLGASVSAGDTAGTFDMVHFLGGEFGVPGMYLEFSYQLSSTFFRGLGAAILPRGLTWFDLSSFIPNGTSRVAYFYDDNLAADPSRFPNRSFASWWDAASNSWVSYAWEGPPAVPPTTNKQLPINHRLDALLSTGQLFSTEGGTGRLYDRDGNLLATFPLGSLVYIGEHYVGGVPRCYFSQSLVFDQAQHFNVYWIRTDQLTSLAN